MTIINNTTQANLVSLGVVQTIRSRVPYTVGDGNSASIGKVPARATIIEAGVIVSESFDAGTANIMFLGLPGDPDSLATVLDISAKGRIEANAMEASTTLYNTEDTEYIATLSLAGTAANQGIAYPYISYIPGND